MLKEKLVRTYTKLIKIRIVHSIPGRVRVSIPYLTRVPEPYRKLDKLVYALIQLKKGINSVEASYITGNVLIKYDKEILDDKAILEWLNTVWQTLAETYAKKPDLTLDDAKEVFDVLRTDLEELSNK